MEPLTGVSSAWLDIAVEIRSTIGALCLHTPQMPSQLPARRAAENSPAAGLARRLREAAGCAGLRRPGRGREAVGLLWRSAARLHALCSLRGGVGAQPRRGWSLAFGTQA